MMMRQREGLSEKEYLRNGNTRKTLFEEDLGTKREGISVDNFNRDGKNDPYL